MVQNKTHGMLDAIETFQEGADLEPIHNLFSRFFADWNMHRVPTNSIGKLLIRRRND